MIPEPVNIQYKPVYSSPSTPIQFNSSNNLYFQQLQWLLCQIQGLSSTEANNL